MQIRQHTTHRTKLKRSKFVPLIHAPSTLHYYTSMRNLVVLNRGSIAPESRTYPDLSLADTVFDPVSDTITFALTSAESGTIEVQQFMKTGQVNVLASFTISNPESKILSFSHFVDSCQLIFVLDNGDIITATYDPSQVEFDFDTTTIEIVGSIDVGLQAASWSPDEETLAILTNENNLILLSRLFEPISEKLLNPDDIKITDSKHVSVGWGKKETQFKGKGFKALEREKEAIKHAGLDLTGTDDSTQLRDPTVGFVEKGTISPFDNNSVKISWRGDCEYFSVSTKEPVLVEDTQDLYDRRVIRVFNREGQLDSVSEAVDGLEHNLSWKPQGSLIASTQRHVDELGEDSLDLVFYERNGLRHGEFNTRLNPETENIINLEWSSNSEVLAFQLHDRVQLWTSKNYHWYLKQEIFVTNVDPLNQVSFIKFHPEKPLNLMIGTTHSGIQIIDLAYKITTGPTQIGDDLGMVLVTDGSTAKITPLSIANVPPPIAFREVDIPGNINDLAVSKSNENFAILTSENEIHLAKLSISETKKVGPLKLTHKIESNSLIENTEFAKQVAFIKDSIIAIVLDGPSYSRIVLFDVHDEPMFLDSIETSPKIVLLKSQADFNAVVLQAIDGTVYQLNETQDIKEITKFPQLCRDFEVTSTSTSDLNDEFAEDPSNELVAFGISTNGKLFANGNQVATAVTSLKITESHLLFTNAHAQLCFIHLKSATGNFEYDIFQNKDNDTSVDERIRQIERGSILVSTMPSKYSVVLEAPRGNLETICPRIMVLSAVRKFIENKDYKDAFLACRTHRIDLDILHDYDPQLFTSNVELFVNQIKKVEHLDLFVSCLHEEDVAQTKYKDTIKETSINDGLARLDINETPQEQVNEIHVMNAPRKITFKEDTKRFENSKVNKICDAILAVLLKPEYSKPYLQTIITAYACQKPPNLKEALKLVGGFENHEEVEQAVTHLCFLQDVNKLYNTALGLYDIKLALSVAQQSQKDPKEYLPFLQNLHIQPQLRKQFLVDDYLKNYEQALNWLHELGEECFEEFDDYVIDHDLYKHALGIYRYDNKRSRDILGLHAQYLHNNHNYNESGLAYEYLGDFTNALENYIMGKKWKEAMAIVQQSEYSEKLIESAERLVSSLTDEHKYAAAAEIEFYFLGNIEEAVKLYCKNYYYEDAILLAWKENRSELVKDIVDVQLGEGFGTIAELLADCKGQMTSQLRRLRELRAKKQEDPYAFYGVPNDELDTPDNVSVAASETSTTPSFFTRYTGKTSGTAKTGASRRTAKNRKREERKKAKGRKGTIYEEEYLIRSVGRLLERLDQTQPDAIRLIEALIRRQMKEQAYQVQKNWVDLIEFIKENIVEIHNMSERDRERIDDNGEVYLIPEIPVPTINEFPKKTILDF